MSDIVERLNATVRCKALDNPDMDQWSEPVNRDGPEAAVEITRLRAENERLRCVLVSLRDTEWENEEPNGRDQLPDAWQEYVEEMEVFFSHYDNESRAALEVKADD